MTGANHQVPSGKHTKSYGKSPFWIGFYQRTKWGIFNSYIKLPEANLKSPITNPALCIGSTVFFRVGAHVGGRLLTSWWMALNSSRKKQLDSNFFKHTQKNKIDWCHIISPLLNPHYTYIIYLIYIYIPHNLLYICILQALKNDQHLPAQPGGIVISPVMGLLLLRGWLW